MRYKTERFELKSHPIALVSGYERNTRHPKTSNAGFFLDGAKKKKPSFSSSSAANQYAAHEEDQTFAPVGRSNPFYAGDLPSRGKSIPKPEFQHFRRVLSGWVSGGRCEEYKIRTTTTGRTHWHGAVRTVNMKLLGNGGKCVWSGALVSYVAFGVVLLTVIGQGSAFYTVKHVVTERISNQTEFVSNVLSDE